MNRHYNRLECQSFRTRGCIGVNVYGVAYHESFFITRYYAHNWKEAADKFKEIEAEYLHKGADNEQKTNGGEIPA